MADVLLIHGSCHGAWCWEALRPELEALGHATHAIDLPGNGDDRTPASAVTLATCRDAILDEMARIGRPVVLVGHSAGGYPVSAAAMARPEAVAHLVYLCAYTPAEGKSMTDRRMDAPRQPLLPFVRKSADGLSYTVAPEGLRPAFYGDCGSDRIAWAAERLCAQPIRPQATPLAVTPTLRALPKSYVRCARDGAIPPEFQAVMADDWPEMTRYDLESDHSPLLSRPAALAALLDRIARG